MNLEVSTVIDMSGEPVPSSFRLGSTTLAVSEVVDRWLAGEQSYFKILAEDAALYILRHDKLAENWEITLFSRNTQGYSLPLQPPRVP